MRRLASYLRSMTGFSRPSRQFLLSMVVIGLAQSIAWLVLNFYLKALRLGETDIGRINSVPSVVLVTLGIFLGRWSDRWGRRRSLIAGAALGVVSLAGLSLSTGMGSLAASAAIGGIGGLLLQGNSPPFMAENSTEEERTRLFAVQAALLTGTGFLGSLVGGGLPRLFEWLGGGAAESVEALRATMMVAAGLSACGVLPLLFLPAARSAVVVEKAPFPAPALVAVAGPGPVPVATDPPAPAVAPALTREAAPAPDGDSSALAADPPGAPAAPPAPPPLRAPAGLFVRLLLPHAFIGLGAGLTMPFMNLYLHGKFEVSVETVGVIFGWSSLCSALFMLSQPWLASRFGKVRAVVATQLCSIPFLLALAYVPWFPLAAVALFLRGALMNMAVPVYNAFCMEKVPAGQRAWFVTLETMCWSAGWAVGSNVSGAVRDALGFTNGFHLLFAGMLVLYVSGTSVFYASFRRERS